jgi:hypothetical protein
MVFDWLRRRRAKKRLEKRIEKVGRVELRGVDIYGKKKRIILSKRK